MRNYNLKLKNAIDFHGHLGPYLVLGLLIGKWIMHKTKFPKHFGIEAIIKGATKRPKSCLIDGIQFSTGCTYGKGNIKKIKGNKIQVLFKNLKTGEKINISLKKDLVDKLISLNNHKDSEHFAIKLLNKNPINLFDFQ